MQICDYLLLPVLRFFENASFLSNKLFYNFKSIRGINTQFIARFVQYLLQCWAGTEGNTVRITGKGMHTTPH